VLGSATQGPARRGAAPGGGMSLSWQWSAADTCELPSGAGQLELTQDPKGPIDLDALPESVSVRMRVGGERLRPRRGGPTRALKNLLQEAHVPPGERARLPLIYSGERLLAAADLWCDESLQAGPGAQRRGRLVWRR
jgi:tRNA(Ile)-lysidine synthase